MFQTNRQFSIRVWCYIILAATLLLGAICAGTMQATQSAFDPYKKDLDSAKHLLDRAIKPGQKP
jgi:hypothetical protein